MTDKPNPPSPEQVKWAKQARAAFSLGKVFLILFLLGIAILFFTFCVAPFLFG